MSVYVFPEHLYRNVLRLGRKTFLMVRCRSWEAVNVVCICSNPSETWRLVGCGVALSSRPHIYFWILCFLCVYAYLLHILYTRTSTPSKNCSWNQWAGNRLTSVL